MQFLPGVYKGKQLLNVHLDAIIFAAICGVLLLGAATPDDAPPEIPQPAKDLTATCISKRLVAPSPKFTPAVSTPKWRLTTS